ncbi:MAG: hypothetical protein Tsb0016_13740 [Sphingomonadales bacterium]
MKTAAFRTGLFALAFSLGVIWLNTHLYGQITPKLGQVAQQMQDIANRLAE